MERMEVPVENNVSIGNGISNIMPLHASRSVPMRGESRERDNATNSSSNIGYSQQSMSHGLGPPSYGSGIVSGSSAAGSYYTPVAALTHPKERDRDKIGGGGAGDTTTTSHKDRERDAIRESVGNRPPQMLKVAVVGESTVGKSAVCNAFTETQAFSKNYTLTCGVDVYAKSIKMPEPFSVSGNGATTTASNMEERVNLILLDSSGKDMYFDLLPRYWDKIDGIAVMVDLTSVSSLESAQRWLDLAKGSLSSTGSSSGGGDKDKVLGVLIGTKMDLTDQRVVSPKMAKDFALQHHLEYFECSARENVGLEEPFFYLAYQWTTRIGANAGVISAAKTAMTTSTNSSNKENQRERESHRSTTEISSVGATRNSAFQRKSSSSRSQNSMEFL